MSMVRPVCPADAGACLLVSDLQHGTLQACISHHRELAGNGTRCYIEVALREVTCPGTVGWHASPGRRVVAPAGDEGGSSPPSRRKPQESQAGVPALTCRHPAGIPRPATTEGSPCRLSTTRFGRPQVGSGRTTLARHRTSPLTSRRADHGSAERSPATSIRGTRDWHPGRGIYCLSARWGKALRRV
jgi:hypothetical protein